VLSKWFLLGAVLFLASVVAPPAQAVPTLQLYIDGATYDPATDTWVTEDTTFDLWVVGNVDGPGGTKSDGIEDVRLAAAFVTGESGTITFTSTTTGAVADPSLPDTAILLGVSLDGAVPLLSDGTPLPDHGVYGPGVSFIEWSLGDFTLTDSPVGDFTGGFPGTLHPGTGQINVYEVSVTGLPSGIHFDVYDSVFGANHSSFGPFSHDASSVPEPRSALLFGTGFLVAGVAVRRRPAPTPACRGRHTSSGARTGSPAGSRSPARCRRTP